MKNVSAVLMRTRMCYFWMCLGYLFGAGVVQAQSVAEAEQETAINRRLPAPEQILERHLAAIGGREKLEQQVSSRAVGKLKMPELGIEAEIKVVLKAPNQLAVEFEVPGAGRVRKATNGALAWEINPFMGTRVIEGKEKEQFMKEADLHAELHHDKYYKSMETLSQVELDGTSCYKMKLITRDDKEEMRYYDVQTHHLVRTEQTAITHLGEFDVAVATRDYREVSELMLPFEVSQEVMNSKQIFVFDSIEINGEVDEEEFAIPDEIKELIATE